MASILGGWNRGSCMYSVLYGAGMEEPWWYGVLEDEIMI